MLLLLWNTGSDRDFARERAVRAGKRWKIPAVAAHRAFEAILTLIFTAFLLVTPFPLARDGPTAQAIASIGLWRAYPEFDAIYLAVRTEPRYPRRS